MKRTNYSVIGALSVGILAAVTLVACSDSGEVLRALTLGCGHADSSTAGESETIDIMAKKNYPDDFKRQAVDLYEHTEGATLRGIAADLGIARGTLAGWVKTLGTGARTSESAPAPAGGRLGALEAENQALRSENQKLAAEREILRRAAKYFAGETNW